MSVMVVWLLRMEGEGEEEQRAFLAAGGGGGASGSDRDELRCLDCSRLLTAVGSSGSGGEVTSGVESAVEGGEESAAAAADDAAAAAAAAASAARARSDDRKGATSLATSPVLCRLLRG